MRVSLHKGLLLASLVGFLVITGFSQLNSSGGALSLAAATATPNVVIQPTIAPTAAPAPTQEQSYSGVGASDMANSCLMCHGSHQIAGVTENSETVDLTVSRESFSQSVHGLAGIGCVACHSDITGYPHSDKDQVSCSECHGAVKVDKVLLSVKLPYPSRRDMTIKLNEGCRNCHEQQFLSSEDSVHAVVLAGGNLESPVCTDCHGSHDITPPAQPRSKIAQTCAKCHEAVYSSYKSSVHGSALELEGNMDVPTCDDCHGVHSIQGPRDENFRNDSIVTCGHCHGNVELMGKYGISSDVFNTYVDDFHGRTVNLFRQQGQLSSSKAVCYDCHGIHNIRKPDDPLSSVNPANLMKTCQQCHDDANERFSGAWLGHYTPDWNNMPILYGVNLFYKFLIPGTLGFFAVYIALDMLKRRKIKQEFELKAEEELEEELEKEEESNDNNSSEAK